MAISTAYVNQILPKDAARVAIPGHVIQVINSRGSEAQYTYGSTYTLVTATITPTYSNSLILYSSGTQIHTDTSGANYWNLNLYKTVGATTTSLTNIGNAVGYQKNGGERDYYSSSITGVANTTNAIIVTLRLEPMSGSGTIRANYANNGWITLMEIAQ